MPPPPDHDTRPPIVELNEIDWVDDEGGPAGVVRLELLAGRAALLVALVGPSRDPVVLLDHDLPLPRHTLEIRSSGLWIDVAVLATGSQWQVGLEAFGLRLDPGVPVEPSSRGERVPVGLDLDVAVVDTGGVVAVEGTVLVDDEVHQVRGHGSRRAGLDAGVRSHDGEPTLAGVEATWPARHDGADRRLERLLVSTPDGPTWVRGPRQSMSASV